MRFLALLIIAFAVFTSANASFGFQDELSHEFQQCSRYIADATKDMAMLREEVNGITTNHKPYSEKLSKTFLDLKSFHSKVVFCCERFAPYRTRADDRAIPTFMSSIINEFVGLTQVLISKKNTIFNDINNYGDSIKYVEYMNDENRNLLRCLVPDENALLVKNIGAKNNFTAYFGSIITHYGSFPARK